MVDPEFYLVYKAVFDAVKSVLLYVPAVPAVPAHDEVPEVPGIPAKGIELLKTVVVGEQFTLDGLPKATINSVPGPIDDLAMDGPVEVLVRGSISVVIREYVPKDMFNDVVKPMGAVVDALLADRRLGGVVKDCCPVMFAPGEFKFKDAAGKDRLLYGGDILFEAKVWYVP